MQQHPIPAAQGILLYPREDRPSTVDIVRTAARWLREREVEVFLPAELQGHPAFSTLSDCRVLADGEVPGALGLVFALGGDGTLLRASRWVGDSPIPVVGANLGDLGFLSAYASDSVYDGLEDAVAGRLHWEPRLRIQVELRRDGAAVAIDCACNDINIKHGAIPRLVRLETYVGGQYMATYRADGLVVCTPLGSTAYNLAAGGPIIEPGLNAFTITPLCPHSLTHRPVVSSANVEIRIVLRGPEGKDAAFLTVDGQMSYELRLGDEVVLGAAAQPLRLVPPRGNVFQILASKLGWSDAGVNSGKLEG